MAITCIIHGLVSRDVKFTNRQRLVNNELVNQPSATFSLYADRQYFRDICGLPRLIQYLLDNHVEDGSSLIVSGRLRIDNYTNQKGVRATSHTVIAQKIKLAASLTTAITEHNEAHVPENVSAQTLVERLRNQNLLEVPPQWHIFQM